MANNFRVRDLIADNVYISENNGNVVNTFGDQLILGDKIFSGSNLFTGDSVSIETTGLNNFGLNSSENNFGAYATLNNYYAGSVIGEFNFDTAPIFIDTTVRDNFIFSSLGATEYANPTTLVTRSSLGYSEFSKIISTDGTNSTSYNSNKITLTIGGDPPDTYTYDFPQASGIIALDSTAVMLEGNQTIAGAKIFSNNIFGNGTQNLLPLQTINNSGSILTRGLADDRFSNRSVRITGDTISHNLEQFVDFVENYTNDLTISTSIGTAGSGPSPSVFGDIWTPSNAGVTGFLGNDLFAHKGIYLYRSNASGTSGSVNFQLNRPTSTNLVGTVTGTSRLFTARLFLPASGDVDFAAKGYFKIGPCQKGGTGGPTESLRGGLMFNPYVSSNLIIGVHASGVASPFTFTTNAAQINFINTNLPYSSVAGRWVNFSYRTSISGANRLLFVDIVRENATLFSTGLNIDTLLSSSGWVNAGQLSTVGASNEIGFNFGKIGSASVRSEFFIDYIHYNCTGSYSLPANWNSLRF